MLSRAYSRDASSKSQNEMTVLNEMSKPAEYLDISTYWAFSDDRARRMRRARPESTLFSMRAALPATVTDDELHRRNIAA